MVIFCVTLSLTEKLGFDLKARQICVHFSAAFYNTRLVWAKESLLNRMPRIARFPQRRMKYYTINHIVINTFVSKTFSVEKKKSKSDPLLLMIL